MAEVIEPGRSRIEDILLGEEDAESGRSRIEDILLSLYQDLVHLNDQGLIPMEYIPPQVFERMVTVANDTERFALTTDDVQNGDWVYVNSTQIMYFVSDEDHLDTEAGYTPVAAGIAAKAVADKNGNQIDTTYQMIIDNDNKLSSDLVDDTNSTNKFTNETEKQTWNGKQDTTLATWAPGSATTHSTPEVGDTITEALQKIDNNQRNDESNISKALTLDVGTALSNGDDLNDYTDSGVYYAPDDTIARSIQHSPVSSRDGFAFRLEVSKNNADDRIIQKIIEVKPTTDITNIYVRGYTYQGWTTWERIATTIDIAEYAQKSLVTYSATSISITGMDPISNASCLLLCTDRRTTDADDTVFMVNIYLSTARITKLAGTYTPTVSMSSGVVTVSGLKDSQSITVLSARALTVASQ